MYDICSANVNISWVHQVSTYKVVKMNEFPIRVILFILVSVLNNLASLRSYELTFIICKHQKSIISNGILKTPKMYSVQFSPPVVSDSLWPNESQHARPPGPLPTPEVYSNSCPTSRWCHLAISFSVIPFSSCPQSLPASECFPMSQLFAWGGQTIGVSALASFLPKKSLGWSPSEWTGCISLQSKGLSRVFSNTPVQKHQFFGIQPLYGHDTMLVGS